MYALIKNGQVADYPTSINAWRDANRTVSLPAEPTEAQLNEVGIFNVATSPQPAPAAGQIVEEGTPALLNGTWTQTWAIRTATSAETALQAFSVRNTRNTKLAACDWTQVADAPVNQATWAAYRQALRDITAQAGFPWDVQWPVEP